MYIKCGDVRQFKSGEVGLVLEITDSSFILFTTKGKCEVISNETPYSSVKLSNELRAMFDEYWMLIQQQGLIDREICKLKNQFSSNKIRLGEIANMISDKGVIR